MSKESIKDNITIDNLLDTWELQYEKIEEVAHAHAPKGDSIHFKRHRSTGRQWRITHDVFRLSVCVLGLAWLIIMYDTYVLDIFDLIPHIFIGILFLYAITNTLYEMACLRQSQQGNPLPYGQQWSDKERSAHLSYQNSRVWSVRHASAAASVALLCTMLVYFTPAFDGRTMSASNRAERIAQLEATNQIINLMKNQNVA